MSVPNLIALQSGQKWWIDRSKTNPKILWHPKKTLYRIILHRFLKKDYFLLFISILDAIMASSLDKRESFIKCLPSKKCFISPLWSSAILYDKYFSEHFVHVFVWIIICSTGDKTISFMFG